MMEIRSHKGQPMLPYNGGKMALEEKPPDILENPEKKTSLDERDAFVRVYIRFVFFVHRCASLFRCSWIVLFQIHINCQF